LATIYDVADAAGVSAKTVSRVLNGDAPVGPETRAAVQAAMDALGYVPSRAARMMRSSRSGLIGLITGAISTASKSVRPQGLPDLNIVQGIQQQLLQSTMTLMIADTGGLSARVPELIDTFLSHRVEGLIYVAEYHQEVELPPVPPSTPMVLVNCFDRAGTPAVLPDDRRGQYDLVARLIAARHRRIAYLTLNNGIVATRLRRDGYRQALTDNGIAFDPGLVAECELLTPDGDSQVLWDAIARMSQLADPPTVYCCGNDKMAMTVYGILRTRGLLLPQAVSVAGYDNHELIAETLYPPLTTVELPYHRMGARGAERLMALISGNVRDDRAPQMIAGPVHWRGSVADLSGISTHDQSVREE
jgi:LacI family transcriptional regulator